MKIELKKLTKEEKFVCEIWCGGIPTDIVWVRESKAFINRMEKFNNGDYDELWKERKSK